MQPFLLAAMGSQLLGFQLALLFNIIAVYNASRNAQLRR